MSNPIFEQVPLRIQLKLISNPPVTPIDINTGEGPRLWRRQSARIDVAIFDSVNVAIDLQNLAYFTITLQREQESPVAIWVKQINQADIEDTVTIADWLNGIAQQVSQVLTPADTDQGLDGETEADYWIIFQGFTEDNAPLIYGAGPITLFDPGQSLPAPSHGYVSRHAQANDAGNSTVTPTSQVHTEVFTVGGVARESDILLGINGVEDGAKLDVIFNLPATADILLNLKTSITGNPTLIQVATGDVLRLIIRLFYDANAAAWVVEPFTP